MEDKEKILEFGKLKYRATFITCYVWSKNSGDIGKITYQHFVDKFYWQQKPKLIISKYELKEIIDEMERLEKIKNLNGYINSNLNKIKND